MNRRDLLRTVPTAGVALLSGCTQGTDPKHCNAETDEWPTVFDLQKPTLEPGGKSQVSIEIGGVTGFQFYGHHVFDETENIAIRVSEASISPSPQGQADSAPPIWKWEHCQIVSIQLPVTATSTAESGEYQTGFRAFENISEPNSINYEYTITVE
jgi:hypothetical protein